MHPEDPASPWTNMVTMQILVALIVILIFSIARRGFSVDNPTRLQLVLEGLVNFISGQGSQMVTHGVQRYVPFFGTLFLFVLLCNLIGILPSFESPTMFPPVPLGCALGTFFYYNFVAVRDVGALQHLKHFAGPVWWLSPLMFPIEVISHLARPLSLTIRLYANMFAGELVFLVFLGLVPLFIPVIFMALHTFVAFLQAYIFVLLTMMYVGEAVAHEH
jgi:F-type H+-transporting ATPase subunit a